MGDHRLLTQCAQRMLMLLALLTCSMLSSGCGRCFVQFDRPVYGDVVDYVTKEPIEGAVVLVGWSEIGVSFENWSKWVVCKEQLTDRNGRFEFWGMFHIGCPLATREKDYCVQVVKPGYISYPVNFSRKFCCAVPEEARKYRTDCSTKHAYRRYELYPVDALDLSLCESEETIETQCSECMETGLNFSCINDRHDVPLTSAFELLSSSVQCSKEIDQ